MVGASCVAAEAFLTHLLRHLAPGTSLGMIYLLGILVVSTLWGLWLGTATLLASGLAFDYFNLPPLRSLFVEQTWVSGPLPIFFAVGLLASVIASLARSLAIEADQRRREADLAAELARLLLRTEDLRSALPMASRRLAQAFQVPSLAIELETVDAGPRTLPLGDNDARIGTLVLPADLPEEARRRLCDRMVPSLEALLRAAHDRHAIEVALAASRDELRRIAEEQAALRRVATLVARGVSPTELFNSVAEEMGVILKADRVAISRYEATHTTVVGSWSGQDGPGYALPLGSRWPLDEPNLSVLVLRTGGPARKEDNDDAAGEIAAWARHQGITSSVGCPILVEGRLWGVAAAFYAGPALQGAEEQMLDFTELVATAISNAHARAELAASRARVVAAADETRRRIERDLHDGAQQRLVSLGLELRAVETAVPPRLSEIRGKLSHTLQGLTGVLEDLQELSRGIHPAILSKGGIAPAVKMLARRCAVPIELDVRVNGHLPQRVEAAIYYMVSEALTNVVKHARASLVSIALTVEEATVRLSIQDDGIGGVDPGKGSGLLGLSDRIDTLNGTMTVASPAGGGTLLMATIPTEDGIHASPELRG